MFSRFSPPPELAARAEAMRRLHSELLTRALRAGSGTGYPRIPTRLVRDGGFDAFMATPQGRGWAAEFWQGVLDSPDPA